jgi:NAD(P)-dependent dehydrogenase (short-subunit alcohol dehydrogenase family)
LPLIADGGRILNVSSGLARTTIPGSGVYGALKAGLETLTRYMAKELVRARSPRTSSHRAPSRRISAAD